MTTVTPIAEQLATFPSGQRTGIRGTIATVCGNASVAWRDYGVNTDQREETIK